MDIWLHILPNHVHACVTVALQPNSVEDIGRAGQDAKALMEQLKEAGVLRRRIDDKNKLLRQMAGNGRDAQFAVVDLSQVNTTWDTFTTQLQQFDAHLDEQKGQLGQTVQRQLDEFKGRLAGFVSRWQELKPKGGPSGNPIIVLTKIDETYASLAELREETAKLQKEVRGRKGEQHTQQHLAPAHAGGAWALEST